MLICRLPRRLSLLLLLGAILSGSFGMMAAWTSAQGTKGGAAAPVEALESPTGFAVHVNFSDPGRLMELSENGRYLVHGISADAEAVAAARKMIREAELEGVVSVERGDLDRLPYTENLVNLLVIDDFSKLSRLSLEEVLRVVAPQGTAWLAVGTDEAARQKVTAELARQNLGQIEWIERDGVWGKIVKPRPEEMDVWTHRRYEASGTAVSQENELDVPNGVRWVAGPNWATHLRYSAVQGVRATEKQLVYFFDEEVPQDKELSPISEELEKTPTGKYRQFSVNARDAYNGLLLWKRWIEGTPRNSQLVARDDRIYTLLEERGSLVGLDPRTGETVKTYKEIRRPREIAYEEDRLLAVTRSDGIVCVDPQSGELLWQYEEGGSDLVAGDGRVFFTDSKRNDDGERETFLISLDLKTGEKQWEAGTRKWAGSSSLPLIFYQEGVLVFGGRATHAASAEDGSHLWTYKYERIGHGGSYSKVLHFDGMVWVHPAESDGKEQYAWEGLDPRTGEVKQRFLQPKDFRMTHRCFEDRASARQILCGTMDFVDIETGEYQHFAAARHSCRDGGVLPGNGQLYTFPHSCQCYPMLRGFMGTATKPERVRDSSPPKLVRGSAFRRTRLARRDQQAEQWTTLRGNAQRSGSINVEGPEQLQPVWEQTVATTVSGPTTGEWPYKMAGTLSAPVVADGTLYVAAIDAHRLEARDAATGETKWTFTADGRIDAPPTLYRGLCLFGARDGRVYCLRAEDGELVWKLHAAPHEERILAYGQLESAWPVVGGVLVHGEAAYFCLGRHSHSDGGIHVYAADPLTGKVLWHAQPEGFTGLSDMLIARGDSIHMITWEFDARTGKNGSSQSESEYLRAGRLGLLDDSWYSRPVALRKQRQQWSIAGEAGQNLVFDQERLFGFRAGEDQTREFSRGIGPIEGDASVFGKRISDRRGSDAWTLNFPQGSQVRAIGVAGERLYFAGRLGGLDDESHAVQVVSTVDGKLIDSRALDVEAVHDGLAISAGRVYLSLQDGRVISLGTE
jgi:outer membrane protein assembly factor BamB